MGDLGLILRGIEIERRKLSNQLALLGKREAGLRAKREKCARDRSLITARLDEIDRAIRPLEQLRGAVPERAATAPRPPRVSADPGSGRAVDRIAALLAAKAPLSMSVKDLVDALDMTLPTVYTYTSQLVHAGIIERVEPGMFRARPS